MSFDDLSRYFPMLNSKEGRPVVSINPIYDDKDYESNFNLKPDAKPTRFAVDGKKFSSIEEMFVHIELTYGNDVELWIDCKDADTICKAWYDSHCLNKV